MFPLVHNIETKYTCCGVRENRLTENWKFIQAHKTSQGVADIVVMQTIVYYQKCD